MVDRKYRSGLEQAYHKANPHLHYEPTSVEYTVPHTYTPDFMASPVFENGYRALMIETKGRFRTYAEASKYIAIVRDNPDYDFMFVFMNPNKPMPGARPRKDGTKLTMGEWADKNNLKWTEFKYVTTPKKKRK